MSFQEESEVMVVGEEEDMMTELRSRRNETLKQVYTLVYKQNLL